MLRVLATHNTFESSELENAMPIMAYLDSGLKNPRPSTTYCLSTWVNAYMKVA